MVDESAPHSRRTTWFVRLALIASVLIFVWSLSLIYHRYITTPQADCSVFVYGKKHLDGYKVRVQRVIGSGPSPAVLTDPLSEKNGYAARFFLPSGTYRIEVWTPDLSLVWSDTAFIQSGMRLSLDLNKRFPAPDELTDPGEVRSTQSVDPSLP